MATRDNAWVERTFGKFGWKESAKPRGAIEILGEWERQNIVAITPPLALADGGGRPVKSIRCHRLVAAPLRRALEELADGGLGHLINTFDGCFEPRHTRWDPKRRLSRHSWGIAVDVNARLFPYCSTAKQDRRLVAAFGRQGFAWGGEWRRPDPMHFEMAELPEAKSSISILLDGKKLTTGCLQEGRAVAPVREVAEALGAMVEARLEEGEVEIHSRQTDGGQAPVRGDW